MSCRYAVYRSAAQAFAWHEWRGVYTFHGVCASERVIVQIIGGYTVTEQQLNVLVTVKSLNMAEGIFAAKYIDDKGL